MSMSYIYQLYIYIYTYIIIDTIIDMQLIDPIDIISDCKAVYRYMKMGQNLLLASYFRAPSVPGF